MTDQQRFDPMLGDRGTTDADLELWPALETDTQDRRIGTEVPVPPRNSNYVDPRLDPLSPDFHDPYYDSEEWVRLPKRSSFARRSFIVLAVLGLGLLAAFWGGNRWLQDQLDPPGVQGSEVVIEIPSGATDNDVVRILADEGVVANSTVTQYYMRYKGAGDFQAGEYIFRQNSEVWVVKDVLLAGPLPAVFQRLTIPEGLWLSQIEDRLLDEMPEFDPGELAAALSSDQVRSKYQPDGNDSLEGLLFPATYQIEESLADNELDMVQRLVSQFDLVADELGLDDAFAKTGYTPYEVLIVASMIEEEALLDEDRPRMARVMYNRLEVGERLGIDATVYFALGEISGPLTVSDLEIDSPYNTRLYPGLPPTPISAPGRASIEAALNPAEGDWFYYVLQDANGSHFFTADPNEFAVKVAECAEKGLGC